MVYLGKYVLFRWWKQEAGPKPTSVSIICTAVAHDFPTTDPFCITKQFSPDCQWAESFLQLVGRGFFHSLQGPVRVSAYKWSCVSNVIEECLFFFLNCLSKGRVQISCFLSRVKSDLAKLRLWYKQWLVLHQVGRKYCQCNKFCTCACKAVHHHNRRKMEIFVVLH